MLINQSVAGSMQPTVEAYGNVLFGWEESSRVQRFDHEPEDELWVYSLVWPWLQCKSGQVISSLCASWLEPIGTNLTQIIMESHL